MRQVLLPSVQALAVAVALSGCGTFKTGSASYGGSASSTPEPVKAPVAPAPVETTTSTVAPQPAVRTAPKVEAKPTGKTASTTPRKVHHKTAKPKPKVAVVEKKTVIHAEAKPAPPLKPVTTKTVPATSTKTAPLRLTADELPFTQGDWTLERNWDNQHPGVCRLVSKHLTMEDGYDKTAVWAEILPDRIAIHTGSNIDLSYKGIGIQFDDSALVPVKGLLGDNGVNIPGQFDSAVADAQRLVVHLGFWPTWPKTHLQQADIPLGGARSLMPSFRNCKNL